jgi:hypothetical protein
MITDKEITDILYRTLDEEQRELLNLVSFCLIHIGIKRKNYKISRDLIFAIKDYTEN